ncbi:MAG: glycosyltransferase family 4 protein, partial [Deltaproteobacteria bacterium]|nr:glycosyltransferase family 4 protein [Candidatus Deferrimicrobium borealis]
MRRMKLSNSSRTLKLLFKARNSLVRKADYFIAISSEIRQQLVDIGVDDNKIVCISNGINIKKFSPVPENIKSLLRRKLSLPEDETIFVYTGRIVVSKGILLLMEVWKQLLLQYNNIHLLLVGSGKGSFDDCDREAYDYMIKQKLEKHISLTGSVDNVNEYLMSSNIFVLPSDYEGFSLALLEGLACGLPSIATKVGGANDLIQNYKNGLLISPKDKEGLKTAIEWMLEQRPQWETMGKRARESAEKYSIEAVANTYIELFEHLKERKIPGNNPL